MGAKFRHRRCILFVVDALAHRIVRERVQPRSTASSDANDSSNTADSSRGADSFRGAGEAAADHQLHQLAELLARGGKLRRCYSIFPSITPAATCTLATGCYPASHGVEGAFWYDVDSDEVAYFGDDLQLLRQRGLHEYLIDFGDRLNGDRLRVPTIFEELAKRGLQSACVNYMWFRGAHVHQRKTPLTLRLLAGKLSDTVTGPEVLKLGDFVETWPEQMSSTESLPGGPFRRYGFVDEVSAQMMLQMAAADALPPFTLAYFPENDDVSHAESPEVAADTQLVKFDRFLGRFVEALGGWESFLDDYAVAIVGDHAQTTIEISDSQQEIMLDEVLSDYSLSGYDTGWKKGEQLFVCPNMRAAAIHIRRVVPAQMNDQLQKEHAAADESRGFSTVELRPLLDTLLADPRIDQVIHAEVVSNEEQMKILEEGRGSGTTVREQPQYVSGRIFWVETADRGRLRFQLASPHSEMTAGRMLVDDFGNRWCVDGDLSALDLRTQGDRLIDGQYPNPLERIAGAYTPEREPVFVTARNQHEFRVRETNLHSGGSHGSLSKDDSEAALITFGMEDAFAKLSAHIGEHATEPRPVRAIDVMPACLDVLESSR